MVERSRLQVYGQACAHKQDAGGYSLHRFDFKSSPWGDRLPFTHFSRFTLFLSGKRFSARYDVGSVEGGGPAPSAIAIADGREGGVLLFDGKIEGSMFFCGCMDSWTSTPT